MVVQDKLRKSLYGGLKKGKIGRGVYCFGDT